MKKNRIFVGLAPLLLSFGANASTVAATLSGGTGTETGCSCVSFSLGWEFTVNTSITVTELGYYDAGLPGLADDHAVGIFDASDNLLTSGVVTNSDPLEGGFRYTDVADVTLSAGNTYWMMGVTATEDYWLNGAITTDSSVTYGGSVYAISDTLVPFETASLDVGYFGGNFKLTVVPIPAAAWLFGSALAGLGWMRRRQAI